MCVFQNQMLLLLCCDVSLCAACCSCLDVRPRTAAFQICETHSCSESLLSLASLCQDSVSGPASDTTVSLTPVSRMQHCGTEVSRNSPNSSRVKHGRKSRIDRGGRNPGSERRVFLDSSPSEMIDASAIRSTTSH